MKIRKIDLAICAMYTVCFKLYMLPTIVQQGFKVICVLGIIIYLLGQLKLKDFINISNMFGIATIVASVVGYMSGTISFAGVGNSILFAICLNCLYSLMMLCNRKFSIDVFVNNFYLMSGIYVILSIVSMVLQGRTNTSDLIIYATGNKFDVSYIFILFTILFFKKNYKGMRYSHITKIKYYFVALLTTCVCVWLYCSTALVLAIILLIVPLVPKFIEKLIFKPGVVVLAVIICGSLIMYIQAILENSFIQHFIVEILNENLILTGRLRIYENIQEIIMQNMWFGHGYGNQVVRQIVGYGNAQNGLMQSLVDYGVIGTLCFLGTIYYCCDIKREKRKYEMSEMGAFILMYLMIIASIVEISYGYIFFIALFLVRWELGHKEHIRIKVKMK